MTIDNTQALLERLQEAAHDLAISAERREQIEQGYEHIGALKASLAEVKREMDYLAQSLASIVAIGESDTHDAEEAWQAMFDIARASLPATEQGEG